ncbi:hypothetical protein ABTY96_41980 [Streptomyces sp. NPDC096057]|uniref:hypothetical protein n=1 Tax=Streptomyces sp. NPDC096057 TaxID=3155543 RepID=UPI00332E0D3A
MTTLRVGAGKTAPGHGWQEYRPVLGVIYIDVDTSAAHFKGTPTYTTSLCSTGGNHLWTIGASSVYDPTATGFRIHLRKADLVDPQDGPLTPAQAAGWGFFIQWIGVDEP